MKKTVFAIIAFACLSAFASSPPVSCAEYLKFEDASSNNAVIENVYCKGDPDYLKWKNEVPVSYYVEQLRSKFLDSAALEDGLTYSGIVIADTIKSACDSAETTTIWSERGYDGIYSIEPFLWCDYNGSEYAIYTTRALEIFHNAANYPVDMVYPIWTPEGTDLSGVFSVTCLDYSCSGGPIQKMYLRGYASHMTSSSKIGFSGLQFVSRDDSLYLCALDSVLYRNGVCVNMDEIRAEAPDSRIVEPEWWETALKIDQPLVFANPIELRLRGNSLGIVSPERGELSLSDVQGRILHSTVVEKGQRWIPLSDYPAGMIVVRLVTRSRVLRGIVSWNGK